jgi:hypothetical protein
VTPSWRLLDDFSALEKQTEKGGGLADHRLSLYCNASAPGAAIPI